MTVEPPAALSAVIDRVVAPEPREIDIAPDVTGALADLLGWWQRLADGPLVDRRVEVAPGPDVIAALEAGIAAGDRAVDEGATLLVPVATPRDPIAARTLMALLTRRESSAVLPQPVGMTDRDWMTACAEVRDRAADVADLRGEPLALLQDLPAPGIAAVVGMLLAAAARRTPCIIDGPDELAAALVADRLCHRARGWWRAGSDSPDPGRAAAIDRIDLAPGLPLGLTDDVGHGARATIALLAPLVG